MNNAYTLLITLGTVAFVAVVLVAFLPLLRRKGIDTKGIIDKAAATLEKLGAAASLIKPFVPGLAMFDGILTACGTAVNMAEQLWLTGQIKDKEKRKGAATDYVKRTLKLIGVEVTPEIDKLIDATIEAEVLKLGHHPKITGDADAQQPTI